MARLWHASSHAPVLASLGFMAFVLAMTWPRLQALAVYALSYWHYGAYWLAYRHGRIALPVFTRHAMLLKSVSLLALGAAYFSVAIDAVSLAVVIGGFALNVLAARALGTDRTYYGHEVAGLPRQRISSFPYGWIAHPMLAGNMAAFGGTLLNADFRRAWWPLAAIHVCLNLALLLMELKVTPLRGSAVRIEDRSWRSSLQAWTACLAGAGLGAAPSAWISGAGHAIVGASLGAAAMAHLVVMQRCYVWPPASSREWRSLHTKGSQ